MFRYEMKRGRLLKLSGRPPQLFSSFPDTCT